MVFRLVSETGQLPQRLISGDSSRQQPFQDSALYFLLRLADGLLPFRPPI